MSARALMLGRFNDIIALKLSAWFSTMACFWLFMALSILPLFWPQSMSVVQFISSGVLQLVALPLLAVAARSLQQQQERHSADLASLHEKHDALHRKISDGAGNGERG